MKIFHLSDLHIGLRLYNRELFEDHRYVFRQICQAARQEQPDAVLIAGDIYDRAVPSGEAVAVFDEFLEALVQAVPQAHIMMISGNHDSAPRLNVFRGVLEKQHIHMIGQPPRLKGEYIQQVTLQDRFGPVHFYLLPFVKPSVVRAVVEAEGDSSLSYQDALQRLLKREPICLKERNVLVSHQFYLPVGADSQAVERMESEVCTVGNIDAVSARVLEPFDYCALGHIHKPMEVCGPCCRYCGTPLACSVSEAGQQKGIVVAELGEKGDIVTRVLPLTPLHPVLQLTGTLEQVLREACDGYVRVTLTDQEDLDVLDMQDRLRAAFPNLLEIRRELQRRSDYTLQQTDVRDKDPLTLCGDFLGELTPEEQALLEQVIRSVQEVQL